MLFRAVSSRSDRSTESIWLANSWMLWINTLQDIRMVNEPDQSVQYKVLSEVMQPALTQNNTGLKHTDNTEKYFLSMM